MKTGEVQCEFEVSALCTENQNLAKELVRFLSEKSMKISFAESCTGGMLAQLLTDVSGASGVFEYGAVSYSNRIKSSLLGVSEKTLKDYTEISGQTAREMAIGVKNISGSDISVSTTGASGPAGAGNSEAGISYVAVSFKGQCRCIMLDTRRQKLSRYENRAYTANQALKLAFRTLKNGGFCF